VAYHPVMFLKSLSLIVSLGVAGSTLAAGRPITSADLLAMARISDPQISPDGTRVLYTVGIPDMKANRVARDVWVVTVATGEAHALTKNGRDGGARWSPDGKTIAFVSTRDKGTQIYVMNPDGSGEPNAITALSGGADNIVWSPDGQLIAFTTDVFSDCKDEACNARRREEREKSPVQAHVADRLLFRHWTSWSEGTRAHLFIVPTNGGAARDLTPGADYDVPPREREGPHPIAFAPDSHTVCYTAVTDSVEARSTNADLFEVDVAGGASKRLTTGPGFDGAPAYSPDGRWLAFRSQATAGYESDKWRLMLLDRTMGRATSLIDGFDRSVDTPIWSRDSMTIFFNAEDRGEMPVFSLSIPGGPPAAATPRPITPGMFDGEFQPAPDGSLIVARSSLASPAELFVVDRSGSAKPLTHQNATLLGSLDLAKAESFTFKGAGSTDVQGFLVRPPAFDASKKYPVLMLLHGGPQTQFGDTWSYRWNAQAFAAPGYVVVMINRRGSTGFGQKFTDEITGDWGGKAFDDLMSGLESVLARYSFTDRERVGAAGASYGGFMIDWMASQARGRFKVLVSHAGVYDQTSMYATEELWFPEHDLGGTPWSNPAVYQKLSPSTYAGDFGKFKTPTLVIAGEQDFRVPYTQSLEFFSALQRQGVPSKLIVFPDEGHWILKPQNSAFWYAQVLDWIARYLQSATASSSAR
jgi:dipeptidyl aminopeptidase/acylaminoacyl peptidase